MELFQIAILCIVAVSVTVGQTQEEKTKLAEYISSKKSSLNYRYRPRYHVAPPVGWMNDPNGFSYYKGQYHIFYQFYPYNATTGNVHWGHSTSPNLVDWTEQPTALIPGEEMCFSGSGIVTDGGETLVLMYTGHHVISETSYNESQYLASSTDGVNFVKYAGNPILKSNGSDDFRDPKVWKNGDYYYVVIGSKIEAGNGSVLLYRSTNLSDWEMFSIIGISDGTLGYMWECPDFFELDGKYILLFSPQGMEPQGDRYKNTFQTGYIIGSFNYSDGEFVQETEFQEIDYGHDFYATQTMENAGKRIMVAWFSMWSVPYPEQVDGWVGTLTIMRELKLVGDRIVQIPVDAMTSLRSSSHAAKSLTTNQVIQFEKTAEIIIKADLNQSVNILLEGTNGGGSAWIKWVPSTGKVVVDRGSDDIRQVEWVPINVTTWRLFLDASSLELFCGEGEVVFSSRVYPEGNWKVTNLSPQTLEIDAYYLRTSVPFPSSSTNLSPLISVMVISLITLLVKYGSV